MSAHTPSDTDRREQMVDTDRINETPTRPDGHSPSCPKSLDCAQCRIRPCTCKVPPVREMLKIVRGRKSVKTFVGAFQI